MYTRDVSCMYSGSGPESWAWGLGAYSSSLAVLSGPSVPGLTAAPVGEFGETVVPVVSHDFSVVSVPLAPPLRLWGLWRLPPAIGIGLFCAVPCGPRSCALRTERWVINEIAMQLG